MTSIVRDIEVVEGIPRELLRAELEQPKYRDAFLASMLRKLRAGDRTALRIYASCMKLVDRYEDMALALFKALGLPEVKVRRYVALVEANQSKTPRQHVEDCAQYILDQEDPELRRLARSLLSELLDAPEEGTNGHAPV